MTKHTGNGKGKEVVLVSKVAGAFAEDKDIARDIRLKQVLPAIQGGKTLVLDFRGVSVATQSFVHALISEALRSHREKALDYIEFKSCNPTVKSVVLTVVEYSLDSLGSTQKQET